MESSLLSRFLTEIRFEILKQAVDDDALQDMDWARQPTLKVCRQLRDETLRVMYRSRDLILELPTFTPRYLDHSHNRNPSIITIHDQHQKIRQNIAAPFLAADNLSKGLLVKLKGCPFDCFRTIRIEVPAPSPMDAAEFLNTWSRLRTIARIFEEAVHGLPDVHLVFLETEDRSWSSEGKLRLSHPGLSTASGAGSSDLNLMLSALISIRRARSIKILTPPSINDSTQATINWLAGSAVMDCRWGSDLQLGCDDGYWNTFLQDCELRFHGLLQNIQTPSASFLRTERGRAKCCCLGTLCRKGAPRLERRAYNFMF